jgi:hypothetical protein
MFSRTIALISLSLLASPTHADPISLYSFEASPSSTISAPSSGWLPATISPAPSYIAQPDRPLLVPEAQSIERRPLLLPPRLLQLPRPASRPLLNPQ